MALFVKKEKRVTIPPKRFSIETKTPLASILSSIIELGDEEDYKYLSKHAAKDFFSKNAIYIEASLVNSEDEMDVFVEFLNYFLSSHGLGDVQIEIDEDEKKVIITHYNSPFLKIYKEDFFLEEFYKLLMELLLEKPVSIAKEIEDEVQTFIVSAN